MSTQRRGRLYACLAFLVSYVTLAILLSQRGARDPDSIFFDPSHAFDRQYSAVREVEAQNLAAQGAEAAFVRSPRANGDSDFCVGITSVKRPGASYLKNTVGSVLGGLTQNERESLYLSPFIADVDPTVHDSYNETWLNALSDQVLSYANAPLHVRTQAETLAKLDAGDNKKKPLFDYIFLLQQCYGTGAPYVVMLEDDVLAAEGWFLYTQRALRSLEKRSDYDSMLYLRLFYNEGLLGFNSERWPAYLIWSASIDALVLASLLVVRHYSVPARKHLTTPIMLTICLICTPMLIGLYFAAGRLTVHPLPRGLNRMDTHGCCSQAFVFPRQRVPELITFYQDAGRGMVDQLTEKFADEKGLARWALTPAVFQHVGTTSSKPSNPSKYGRRNTELIWNFEFETMNQKVLRELHE